MLKYLWNRIKTEEQGFTLVELLIVIVILGVLAGIGIPTYKGFIERSYEAATKSELAAVSAAMKYAKIEKDKPVEDIFTSGDDIEILQAYLGKEDLQKQSDKWQFMGTYELSITNAGRIDAERIDSSPNKDKRLAANVTENSVITSNQTGSDGYVDPNSTP